MKIVLDVPDASADQVAELMGWIEARRLSAFGQVISVFPAESPWAAFFTAPLRSVRIAAPEQLTLGER